jgi:antitoxin component YwqK of YwqJK toxin-antitoxin module
VDSFWFFTGTVKDYSMADTLLMDGKYTAFGYKTGLFKFYFPDGKLKLMGRYENDTMRGPWQWYYDNGGIRAIVNLDGDSTGFKFVQFTTREGKNTLANGTGDFEWYTSSKIIDRSGYKVTGSFLNGKRSGVWKYYQVNKDRLDLFLFKEKYEDDGTFKKSIVSPDYYLSGNFTHRDPHTPYTDYNFEPTKIYVTERMAYDKFFRREDDSTSALQLKKYLINRKAAEIIVKDSTFEKALLFVIHTLENNSNRLDYQHKEIDGSIEFKIGDNGYPENITVTGNGIIDKEKEFIIFLLGKFHNIQMPGMGSVAIEGYHTIYLYSLNMKEFMPANLKDQVNNELFFSTLTKDMFLSLLRASKKKIKKYIREEYSYYW